MKVTRLHDEEINITVTNEDWQELLNKLPNSYEYNFGLIPLDSLGGDMDYVYKYEYDADDHEPLKDDNYDNLKDLVSEFLNKPIPSITRDDLKTLDFDKFIMKVEDYYYNIAKEIAQWTLEPDWDD